MKRRESGILHFLSLHNPFYLLSALMMLIGCFGLARAVALKLPEWRQEIERALFAG